MEQENLKESVKRFPQSPGVYIMKNGVGQVIYVGKALNLRDRVSSYFGSPKGLSTKTLLQMQETRDIEFVTVPNEHEALILEFNLIKAHSPHYNIDLKDGHSYPYIKLNIQDDYPHFWATRMYLPDGSMYFGPFSSSSSVRHTLKLLKEIFQFRTCRQTLQTKHTARSCLEYQIKNCSGPCIGAISREDYNKNIKKAISFLNGRHNQVLRDLNKKMGQVAEKMQYEQAALIRDRINAVCQIADGQKLNAKNRQDQDILAVAIEDNTAAAQTFTIRQGRLIGREAFILQGADEENTDKIISEFIKLFYGVSTNIPALITVYQMPLEHELLQQWLKERCGRSVLIKKPRIGPKAEMAQNAYKNAMQALERHRIKNMLAPEARASQALMEIKESLQMNVLPHRIECFDISNTQGTLTVASMSVFVDGKPQSAAYRRFRVRRGDTADDFASIKEVIKRRLKRLDDSKFAASPNLILIDGGRGQLNAALEAFKEAGVDNIFLASIAKQQEEIFVVNQQQSLSLPPNGAALLLLRHIRDEAHRFAITYHRQLRAKKSTASALDEIPEIGPVRRRQLLKHFGSLADIRQASMEELSKVQGISQRIACLLKEFL